jgi:hypothetical protein
MTCNAYITKYKGITRCINADHYDQIYETMMDITDGDHEISSDAASWCELAAIGETYEFREGIIRIVEEGTT